MPRIHTKSTIILTFVQYQYVTFSFLMPGHATPYFFTMFAPDRHHVFVTFM